MSGFAGGRAPWVGVEKDFINKFPNLNEKDFFDNEQTPAIVVKNIYELGDLVALKFLEWVRANPTGVIALPTGRTPEFFIKTLDKYKADPTFDFPRTSGLRFVMLDEFFPMLPTHKNSFCRYIRAYYCSLLDIPDENILSFDVFAQNIVTESDIALFNDCKVDISLLTCADPSTLDATNKARRDILLRVQKFCDDYEQRIAALGGIGFFLGGIGPDGHIAFNQPGESLQCKTRLVTFNYPSAAAAAGDLGGIEKAKSKAAMTIGLGTITANAGATIIILAAGEGKAGVVQAALEGTVDKERPASSLHAHGGARFYLTEGAASHLTTRLAHRMAGINHEACMDWAMAHMSGVPCGIGETAAYTRPPAEYILIETLIYQVAMECRKAVHSLTSADMKACARCPIFLHSDTVLRTLVTCASRRLREKCQTGLAATAPTRKSIMHTAPHHDDILLSYHAAMHRMLGKLPSSAPVPLPMGKRLPSVNGLDKFNEMDAALGEMYNENVNHFAYLTSGFHSVSSDYLEEQCRACIAEMQTKGKGYGARCTFLEQAVFAGEMDIDYDDLMSQFREAFLLRNFVRQEHIEHVLFLRKLAEVYNISCLVSYTNLCVALRAQVDELLGGYLATGSPSGGDAVPKAIQLLKGCMRETEVDRVWAVSRMPMNRVHHLRSKFYTDDFFTPMPSLENDAMPFANLLRARQPQIITVAFDPEGTGPDTHYKVLLVVAAGLRIAIERGDLADPDPIVWGYRNVWFEFSPSDATLLVPVTMSDLDLMHDTFMSCFTTQKTAAFPSPFHDGPFSEWSRELQATQSGLAHTLLGQQFFDLHEDERVREAEGFVFIKAMRAQQFLQEVEVLQNKFENH